jgi:hypothetical protein
VNSVSARRRAETEFTWEAAARALESVHERIVAAAKQR